jgi:hypothetical protein
LQLPFLFQAVRALRKNVSPYLNTSPVATCYGAAGVASRIGAAVPSKSISSTSWTKLDQTEQQRSHATRCGGADRLESQENRQLEHLAITYQMASQVTAFLSPRADLFKALRVAAALPPSG